MFGLRKIKRVLNSKRVNLKSGLNNFLLYLKYNLYKRPFSFRKKKSFLILPGDVTWFPFTDCSLGDDIMFLSVCQELRKRYPKCKISFLYYSEEKNKVHDVSYFGFDIVVENISNYITDIFKYEIYNICSNYSDLIILGADVLDGAYGQMDSIARLNFAKFSSDLGLSTRILGFSFNDRNIPEIKSLIRTISSKVKLYVRDEISFNKLSCITSTNLILSADISFVINPNDFQSSSHASLLFRKLESVKEISGRLIGINLISWNLEIDKRKEFLSYVVRNIENLFLRDSELYVVLIPHDFRKEHGDDNKFLNELYQMFDDGNKKRIFLADIISTGIDAKRIVGFCDVVLTGRMHLAIAAMSQNVPALSFVYQGKFEGLYKMFNLDCTYMLNVSELTDFQPKIIEILENLDTIKEGLQIKNREILKKSKLNFE